MIKKMKRADAIKFYAHRIAYELIHKYSTTIEFMPDWTEQDKKHFLSELEKIMKEIRPKNEK